jgi:hypothetical protein
MITVRLTSYNGNTKAMPFYTEAQVRKFIATLPSHLNKNTSLKLECDLLAISGTIRGEINEN